MHQSEFHICLKELIIAYHHQNSQAMRHPVPIPGFLIHRLSNLPFGNALIL